MVYGKLWFDNLIGNIDNFMVDIFIIWRVDLIKELLKDILWCLLFFLLLLLLFILFIWFRLLLFYFRLVIHNRSILGLWGFRFCLLGYWLYLLFLGVPLYLFLGLGEGRLLWVVEGRLLWVVEGWRSARGWLVLLLLFVFFGLIN